MAKFFIGVIVGISLGGTVSAYGAVASQSGALLGWTVVTRDGVEVYPDPNANDVCDHSNGSHPWRTTLSR
jgi:hypothetical protein